MAKDKGLPSVSTMYAFGRGCGIRLKSVTGLSAYTLTSMALVKLGHPVGDLTYKDHVKKHIDVVNKYAAGNRKSDKIKSAAKQKISPVPQKNITPKNKTYIVGGVDVVSNEFLQTYEWRVLRMQALKKYGAVCMCCGASPKTGAVMNVDHIKPRRFYPELALDLNNTQILCNPCNHGKGSWDQTDWRS